MQRILKVKGIKVLLANSVASRGFGGHGRDYHPEVNLDWNKNYISATDQEHKYSCLFGIKVHPDDQHPVIPFDTSYNHYKGYPQHRFEVINNSNAHDVLDEDNPLVHGEPYGYFLGDDPYEERGFLDYPFLLIFAYLVCGLHLLSGTLFEVKDKRFAELLYHTRETADMIEERIGQFRVQKDELVTKIEALKRLNKNETE